MDGFIGISEIERFSSLKKLKLGDVKTITYDNVVHILERPKTV